MESTPIVSDQGYFPFQVQLHLKPFIEHWRTVVVSDHSGIPAEYIEKIEHTLKAFPFLEDPTKDITTFKPHQEFLDLLFSVVFPKEGFNDSIQAVCAPFTHHPMVATTKGYLKLTDPLGGSLTLLNLSISGVHIELRVLYAYKFILKKFYNLDLKVDHPVITLFHDKGSGLSKYFKLTGHVQFVEVFPLAPLPAIDSEILQRLLDQQFDHVAWEKVLPPELFLFSGVTIITLIDVTTEYAAARIQHNLLDNHGADEITWFNNLRLEIQNLFRLQGLRLGIATIQRNGELNFTSKNPLWNSLLLRELEGEPLRLLPDSVYEEIMKTGQTIIIEDLNKYNARQHPLIQALLKAGYNNILCAPIYYNNQLIGIFELASPNAGEVNGLSLFKINQVKPILAIAAKRLLEEFENKVEAIMLQQFTSIHPAIEWRFRDAAIQVLDHKGNGVADQDIIFENVYPFYGSLDIRDSSKKRSKAIERDLIFNLEAAIGVLRDGYETLSFDILGELINDVEKCRDKIKGSFASGDEASVSGFIRNEINPVISHLYQQYPQLIDSNPIYHETVRSGSGICTQYRLGYEEALALINNCIIKNLDAEEADLQRLYPCYFEKYRTDGVEYNIYAGPSIARGRDLDPLYLDNLRLRQLLWTCKIMKEIETIRPQLQQLIENKHDLSSREYQGDHVEDMIEIAPLILAYATPITLKFRPEEKRLDVDGSYNVRYEMLKKRIDKATILGGQERLTQPGHIAIVFTQDHEATTYERHLNYLAMKGFILKDWTHLDLEPIQGVEGLRALRAKVN